MQNKMTKNIRIENADTSDHKVVVEIWDGDVLAETHDLNIPTQMLEKAIWQGHYIIIKEVE